MNRAIRRVLIPTLPVAIMATACAAPGPQSSGSDLTGSVNIDGSSTVFPITQAIAEVFNEEAPGVRVAVGISGTGGGFKKFCAGETDISDASRPIKAEEHEVCKDNGIEHVELQVAIDGLSVLINPSNSWASCLTVDELKKVWEPGSTVSNWKEVRAGFPDRPLTLYGAGTDSGTFDYFTEVITGESGASRSDFTASEDDNVLVQGIAGDENSLGFFGFAYYVQNQDKLKTLAVDGGGGCVAPTETTINEGDYTPLSRPIFIYVSTAALEREEVVAFVDFYLEQVNALVTDVGYITMPQSTLDEQVEKWKGFKQTAA